MELEATITALASSPEVYCKYPARRIWLEKAGYSFPTQTCTEFDTWSRNQSAKSISLIFATGFLGNPASYFGHPLLKINYKDDRSPLDLMDTAINYGAFTPSGVDPLSYAIKGMFGGYDAGFTAADFFFHKKNYSELELRDMWEYELDLTQDQIDTIVAHLWEMRDAKIKYYFFKDNCAFRMAELLELVIDKKLLPKNGAYSIPIALFHKLHDLMLVKDIKLLESRQTRLNLKVSSLNSAEFEQLHKLVDDPDYVSTEEFKVLSQESQSRGLETAMDYYSFRMVIEKTEELQKAKKKVLMKRFSLPAGQLTWNESTQKPPHEAQKPVLTQFGYFYSEKFKNSGSFRFRPVFYDLVSPDAGRPEDSSLVVMDVEFNLNQNQLWLKSLNLIALESLNLSRTHLPGDGGFAWRFKLGAEQLNLACNTCTIALFEGGLGKAWQLSEVLTFYTMLDPRLQSQHSGSGHLGLTPNLASLITISDEVRMNASAGRRFMLDSKQAENIFSIDLRIGASKYWDLRLGYQEHVDKRYSMGLDYFW